MAMYVLEIANGCKVFFCAEDDREVDRFIREKVFPGREIHREDEMESTRGRRLHVAGPS